jgi:hypothetical protein
MMVRFSLRVRECPSFLIAPILGLGGITALWAAVWSLRWPLVHDSAVMHYIAWSIKQGAVPYRDLFDMQFPATYLIHMLVLSLPGPIDLVWRVFDLTLLTITLGLMAAFIGWRRPWSATAAVISFALLYFRGGAAMGGQRDMFIVALEVAAIFACALLMEQVTLRARYSLIAGFLFGAAFMIKPFAGLFFAGEMVFVGYWTQRQQGARNAIAAVAAGLVGFSIPVVAILIWLLVAGGFWPFVDVFTHYVMPFYSRWRMLGWQHLGHILFSDYPYPILLLGTLIVGLAALTRPVGARMGLLLVAVPCAVGHFLLQRKGWDYHLLPLAAFGSMACFWPVQEAVFATHRLRATWISMTMAVILPLSLVVAAAAIHQTDPLDRKHQRALALAAFLRENVRHDDSVQVLDTTAGGTDALLRAHLRLPTRFMYDIHFFQDEPSAPYIAGLRRDFLRELAQQRPRFIVVFETGGYERVQRFVELATWLDAGYRLQLEGDGYRVFERKVS